MYGRQKTFKVKGRSFTYYPSESLSKNVQVVTVSHVTTSVCLDELIGLAAELDVDYETVEISSYDYELEFETKIQETDEMYGQRMKWIENNQSKAKAENVAKLDRERKEYERLKKKFGDS
jgi:MoaA/NifB/PqqE/SkfB family radical SAM enzyme